MKTILLFLLLPFATFAQTLISGGILTNTTWTAANSPYIVTGNIVVFDGVLLTIEPGVIVKFDSGTGIELRGKLVAVGNAVDNITFTSNLSSPSQSSWTGFKVVGTTSPLGEGDQVLMEYCRGEYAHYFINLDIAYHGPYVFRQCHFSNNYQVNYDGGLPSTIFEDCKFESNHTALVGSQFDSRVSRSHFINNVNGVRGFVSVDTCYFSGNTGVALDPTGTTQGCIIQNNNIGVSCFFNSSNHTFINNYVSDNVVGVEMKSFFNGINFTGNSICNNTDYNVKLLHHNTANLAMNCWCSTDSTSIRSGIYDGYANISHGLVNFMPFATDCTQLSLGIDDLDYDSSLSFTVYPNPFSQEITFALAENTQATISFYGYLGQQVFKQTFTNTTTIDTGQLADGVYFYELKDANGTLQTGKLIKR